MRLAQVCRVVVVIVAFSTATGAARAQDAGIPAVCGNLTDEGVCIGETAVWCSEPNVDGEGAARDTVSIPCDDEGGTCADVGGAGAWCLVPPGTLCARAATDRTAQFGCGDGVVDLALGCDLEEGCRPVSVPCPPDGETTCADGTLVLSCASFGQPLVVRCAGTCAGALCQGQPEDALCDDERLTCAEGLACLGAPTGRCVDATSPPATDAGPDRRDPFEPTTCRCVRGGSGSVGLVFAHLALLPLVFVSRRRRRSPASRQG